MSLYESPLMLIEETVRYSTTVSEEGGVCMSLSVPHLLVWRKDILNIERVRNSSWPLKQVCVCLYVVGVSPCMHACMYMCVCVSLLFGLQHKSLHRVQLVQSSLVTFKTVHNLTPRYLSNIILAYPHLFIIPSTCPSHPTLFCGEQSLL